MSLLRNSVLASALCLASSTAIAVELQPLWHIDGLANPESVAADASGSVLYVSNVAGDGGARDGNGFVARLSSSGELLDLKWLTGLHAPKGMVVVDGLLYVADIDHLVVIEIASRTIRARHPAPGAKFLNDVAVAPNGDILVSDSATARIFSWNGNELADWLLHDSLRAVNGLLPEPERLLVTTMAGKLLSVDWNDQSVTELADGLGNADGIVRLDDGSLLVGEWPGRLFHIRDGETTTLIDSREEKRYLNDFLRIGDLLLVPNWEPSTLTAYRIR